MDTIKVFLASSTAGLEQERLFFTSLIKSISIDKKIDIEPWTWEEDRGFYSQPGEAIQSSINPELKNCSVVFFVFYNKLGKGVREEFEKACEYQKKYTFYAK